jgi:hypothetical protein
MLQLSAGHRGRALCIAIQSGPIPDGVHAFNLDAGGHGAGNALDQ